MSAVSVYLVGASWCGYTKQASSELSTASQQIQQYSLTDVVNRVYCDQDATQAKVCSLAKGFPALVACQADQCRVILDGYMPGYAASSAQAINAFLDAAQ